MNFLITILLVFSFSLGTSIGFAEGTELICPETSGNYFYVNNTASYEELPFEGDTFTLFYCEYEAAPDLEQIPFGEVYAIYNSTGLLIPELMQELECGSALGAQFYPTLVSSSTHFASVSFSSSGLIEAASQMMAQIEDQNLAPLCIEQEPPEQETTEEEQTEEEQTEEEQTEEELNPQEPTIEITSEELDEKTIEEIIEEIEDFQKNEEDSLIELQDNNLASKIVLPDWIKDNAEWWSTSQITDNDFASGIEYMIEEGIIKIPSSQAAAYTTNDIPDWVKDNAGWWAKGLISNDDFVNGLQYLISNGIISVT